MASYANGTGTVNTIPGALYAQGVQGNIDLANRWSGNKTVSGLVAGSLIDINTSAAKTGLALQYNDAFMSSLHRNNMAMADADVGRASTLIGVQTNADKDIIKHEGEQDRLSRAAQGEQDRLGYVTQGEQARLGYRVQGEEQRKGTVTSGEQDRLGYQTQGEEQRKGYVTQGEQERLNIASRGTEERKSLVTTGEQARLGQDNESTNVIRLREDARRQIERQGRRFYA